MSRENIKSFKIINHNDRVLKNKYMFMFNGTTMSNWFHSFFNIYTSIKYPMLGEKILKCNDVEKREVFEERYLEIVKEFINAVRSFKNDYSIFKAEANEKSIYLKGYNNREILWMNKDDIFSITSPSFKNMEISKRYEFEKEFFNPKNYDAYTALLADYRKYENPILKELFNSVEFQQKLNIVLEEAKSNFVFINDKTLKDNDIRNLKEKINYHLPDSIKTELLEHINSNTNVIELNKIRNFVNDLYWVNRDGNVEGHISINDFNDFITKNSYLKKLYLNSLSKEEIEEIKLCKEGNDLVKSKSLKERVIERFWKNHQKDIVKLFIKNNLSVRTNHSLEFNDGELERD